MRGQPIAKVGIDRPFDRPASAFRGAPERRAAEPGAFSASQRLSRTNRRRLPTDAVGGRTEGVRRSSPLVFWPRRAQHGQGRVTHPYDLQHPHQDLRQPQRAPAQAVQRRRCSKINALEPAMAAMSDDELKAKTATLKERVANGEELDVGAARGVRRRARGGQANAANAPLRRAAASAAWRCTTARSPKCAPARARRWSRRCLPISMRSTGNGVHIVTVNDYLAQRDADWMGRIYRFLGLDRRREPVADGPRRTSRPRTRPTSPTAPTTSSASTTCATTWCSTPASACSAACRYAIVDEVDSILIDEARTPLIISGQSDDNVEMYYRLNELAPKLVAAGRREGRRRLLGRREGEPGAAVGGGARARRADAGKAGIAARRHRASTTRTTSR